MTTRIRLLLAEAQGHLTRGPRQYAYPIQGQKPWWCMGCGTVIPAGDLHARDDNGGRVCEECVQRAERVDASGSAAGPAARIFVKPDVMQMLMDGAADEVTKLGARVAVIAIRFDDTLTRDEIHGLSRSWTAKISEKRVVAEARVRVYAEAKPVPV